MAGQELPPPAVRCATAARPHVLPAVPATPSPKTVQGLRVCNMLEGGVTPLHSQQELKSLGEVSFLTKMVQGVALQ